MGTYMYSKSANKGQGGYVKVGATFDTYEYAGNQVSFVVDRALTREYPDKWTQEKEPYYPINNERNNGLYEKYKELANQDKNIIFGGRLGQYKYYDMDKVIASALQTVKEEL